MRIGIDLDNTIIFYDEAFVRAGIDRGLLPAGFIGTKQQVRDTIRKQEDGERQWQALQGHVYGKAIGYASLFPGVDEFITACREKGDHEVFIVSHKTEFGHYDPDRVPLRDAAREWLEERKIFGDMVPQHLYFANTRHAKVEIINELNLDWFIDDLIEVYEERHFPANTKTILLHTIPEKAPQGKFIVCRSWEAVQETIFGKEHFTPEELKDAAGKLIGQPADTLEPAAAGGNSRVYKVTAAQKNYALKQYPSIHLDKRDRLGTEKKALQFLEKHHTGNAPRWIASEPPLAIMEWIDGTAVTSPTGRDIEEAVAFLSHIFLLSAQTPESSMPLASEACLSGKAILRQLENRMEKLYAVTADNPALGEFLDRSANPALRERVEAAKAIYRVHRWEFDQDVPTHERRLIPADFGFHNALRMPTGKLAFIDFEYFGWDDPVKLIADFLLHPATALTAAMKDQFMAGMLGMLDPSAKTRLLALYPLFGLRWSLILLSEFLPDHWKASQLARGAHDWETVKKGQLEKANAMLAVSKKL